MTTVYFVRHGETTANASRIFQGISDFPLSPKGIAQGKLLQKRFAQVPYDHIFSSPLSRAVDTAKILNEGHPCSVEILPILIEVDGGVLEGEPFATMAERFPKQLDLYENHHLDFVGEGATDGGVRGAWERVQQICRMLPEQYPEQTVVLVAHGAVLRSFNCFIQGFPFEKLPEVPWGDNTCVTCVRLFPDRKPEPVYINDASHVTSDQATKDVW